MKLPHGLILLEKNIVYKLLKSLYGFKQASRQWHSKLHVALLSRGYKIFKNDYSLFYKKTGSSVVFLAVYVDDIMVVGNDVIEINSIKAFLDSTFKIKDLGKLHYFLGNEFNHFSNGVTLSQRKFALELLK